MQLKVEQFIRPTETEIIKKLSLFEHSKSMLIFSMSKLTLMGIKLNQEKVGALSEQRKFLTVISTRQGNVISQKNCHVFILHIKCLPKHLQ